jgi:hypothetical protein
MDDGRNTCKSSEGIPEGKLFDKVLKKFHP